MKRFKLIFLFLVLVACQKNSGTLIGEQVDTKVAFDLVALESKISTESVIEDVVVTGTVSDVCKAKGCWMKLTRENGEDMRVTFKDYALFMPKDIVGKEVAIHGIASQKEISIADLQHYAKDAGKSKEEITSINSPQIELSFEADGVVIK
ncbi:MAG: DUF4920 domain-containing protein [Bacteroidota bacterium]